MRTKFTRGSGVPMICIGGKVYDQPLARIIFKCAECLGDLVYRNSGLACAADPAHKGYIHRDKAREIAAEQARQYAEVEAGYQITNGQIVPKIDGLTGETYAAE